MSSAAASVRGQIKRLDLCRTKKASFQCPGSSIARYRSRPTRSNSRVSRQWQLNGVMACGIRGQRSDNGDQKWGQGELRDRARPSRWTGSSCGVHQPSQCQSGATSQSTDTDQRCSGTCMAQNQCQWDQDYKYLSHMTPRPQESGPKKPKPQENRQQKSGPQDRRSYDQYIENLNHSHLNPKTQGTWTTGVGTTETWVIETWKTRNRTTETTVTRIWVGRPKGTRKL